MSKYPWARYWTLNCSWQASLHFALQPLPLLYECVGECVSVINVVVLWAVPRGNFSSLSHHFVISTNVELIIKSTRLLLLHKSLFIHIYLPGINKVIKVILFYFNCLAIAFNHQHCSFLIFWVCNRPWLNCFLGVFDWLLLASLSFCFCPVFIAALGFSHSR